MKIGVKTFKEIEVIEEFNDKADFFEIMAIEDIDYSFLKKSRLPIVIHAQHGMFGVNNADKKVNEKNLSSINFARKIADFTEAKKIILHPGDLNDKDCTEENAIEFIKNLNDKRIIIENMSGMNIRLCETTNDTKRVLNELKLGFCFDINHAIQSAIYHKKDYWEVIKKFIELKPVHYHLGGQKVKQEVVHQSFENSDLDLKKLFSILPKDAEITLEVTKDIEKTKKDLDTIRRVIKELSI